MNPLLRYLNNMQQENGNYRIYVITVKGFNERQQSIDRQLRSLALPYTFILRHDPSDLAVGSSLVKFSEPSALSVGEQSAVAKHAEAWRLGYLDGAELVLILEDDALLSADFCERFQDTINAAQNLSAGFLINLGCANARTPKNFNLAEGFLCCAPIETAEAYLTDRLGLLRRLNWLKKNRVALPADHAIREIDANLGTVQYWTMEALVEQGSLKGDFVSTLDHKRASTHPMLIHLGYLFRRYKRRILPSLLSNLFRRYRKNVHR